MCYNSNQSVVLNSNLDHSRTHWNEAPCDEISLLPNLTNDGIRWNTLNLALQFDAIEALFWTLKYHGNVNLKLGEYVLATVCAFGQFFSPISLKYNTTPHRICSKCHHNIILKWKTCTCPWWSPLIYQTRRAYLLRKWQNCSSWNAAGTTFDSGTLKKHEPGVKNRRERLGHTATNAGTIRLLLLNPTLTPQTNSCCTAWTVHTCIRQQHNFQKQQMQGQVE